MQKSARKSRTLNLNSQFTRIYKSGASCVRPTLVVYARPNNLGFNRLGVTVTKKIGKAHIRNRAKYDMPLFRLLPCCAISATAKVVLHIFGKLVRATGSDI